MAQSLDELSQYSRLDRGMRRRIGFNVMQVQARLVDYIGRVTQVSWHCNKIDKSMRDQLGKYLDQIIGDFLK